MVFTGLIEKLKGKAKAASFATKLAIAGGLSSLVGYNSADAQIVYMNAEIKDSNGQSIQGNTLQTGQTYTGLLSLRFEDPSNSLLQVSDLKTAFQATFGGVGNATNVNIQYTSNSNASIQGVPTNDLFSNSTMTSTNNTTYSSTDSTVTLGYNRAATTPTTSLTLGQNIPLLSFTITPQMSAAGGSVTFNYLTGSTTDYNLGGKLNGTPVTFSLDSNSDSLRFLGGTILTPGNLQFNFVAVPEPSTYALIAGGAALIGAAALRRRRKLMQANGKMYELSGEYQNGKDIINVRQIGNISDKQ